ncbi:MAG: enoyl-CoA hydratase/isomerase family protein [Sterolibacterium sp.]
MNSFATIQYRRVGRIAYVTLNRPQVLNVFSVQMRDDLFEVLSAIRLDDEICILVLNGAGDRAFCAGADLSEFLTAPSALAARHIRAMRDLWGLMRAMPQPVICALHGYVLGSGVELAMFCDIRIAASDTIFGLPEVHLGILPGAGGTQTVRRAIGLSQSLSMMLANRRINAEEALRCRMLNRVVGRDELADTVEEMAASIAGHKQETVRALKQLVMRGTDLSLLEGLRMEHRRVC